MFYPAENCLSSVEVCNRFVETHFRRSSSGFCEKFAGHGGSGPDQAEGGGVVDSASCFLDLNSNGDLVTRALADLDLNSSVELLGNNGSRYNNDNQHSMTSCDTAELLRTPSPCSVVSDHEPDLVETAAAAAENRNASSTEQEKDTGEQDQWGALSSIHKGKGEEFCMQVNGGIQSAKDIPATSTPKKQKVNGQHLPPDAMEILEGRFEASAYHRDGTRVGWYNCYSPSPHKEKLQY